jgi:hypothetical protein
VTDNHDNSGYAIGPQRSVVQSTIVLALAAAAAFAAAVTDASASTREVSASSYGFADSLLTSPSLERPPAWPALGGAAPHGCVVNCGPVLGTFVVQRSEMLTSNTADVSLRKTVDANGHQLGVGGMTIVERLETNASGLASWVVVSERTLDETSSHSWSLLSGFPFDALWLTVDLYHFEGSSFSVDLLPDAHPTPEASTWVMMLIGFAGLGFAGCRNSGKGKVSLLTRKGAHVR